MNPTAEDILNMDLIWIASRKIVAAIKHHNPGSFSDELWSELEEEWFDYLKETMEEYSLLKSKEAADKAWEAGDHHGRNIGYYEGIDSNDERQQTRPESKETFMKELFKDQRS